MIYSFRLLSTLSKDTSTNTLQTGYSNPFPCFTLLNIISKAKLNYNFLKKSSRKKQKKCYNFIFILRYFSYFPPCSNICMVYLNFCLFFCVFSFFSFKEWENIGHPWGKIKNQHLLIIFTKIKTIFSFFLLKPPAIAYNLLNICFSLFRRFLLISLFN